MNLARHRTALRVLAAAGAGDLVLGTAFGFADRCGVWDGLYFALTTATTAGYGDIVPHGWVAHLLAIAMMITIIPLFAASLSLFTASLTGEHVEASEQRLKDHVEQRLKHHLGKPDA